MPRVTDEAMPSLSPAENARRDAEADRDFETGGGYSGRRGFCLAS